MLNHHKIKAALVLNTKRGHLFPGFQARCFRRAGTNTLYQYITLDASLPKKRENGFPYRRELLCRNTPIVIFSMFIKYLIKSIKSFKAHTIKQIALCPHNALLPIGGQWIIKFKSAMPRHCRIWGRSTERHNGTKSATLAKSGRYYHDRSGLYDFRRNEPMKITNQNCAGIGMKINRHTLDTLNILAKCHNEISYA
jgi:hypothetical protein